VLSAPPTVVEAVGVSWVFSTVVGVGGGGAAGDSAGGLELEPQFPTGGPVPFPTTSDPGSGKVRSTPSVVEQPLPMFALNISGSES